MPEGKTPDEVLRLNAAINLRRHEGIRNALTWFRENPQELEKKVKEFDAVLNTMKFDEALDHTTRLAGMIMLDDDKHTHAKKLETMLNGKKLPPSLAEMARVSETNDQEGILKSVTSTFAKVNDLLSGEWKWAASLDPQQTASGLLIEGYGLMAEDSLEIPGLRRTFVEAFEENLILEHSRFSLLDDVVGWMKEEKSSFSPTVQAAIGKYLNRL